MILVDTHSANDRRKKNDMMIKISTTKIVVSTSPAERQMPSTYYQVRGMQGNQPSQSLLGMSYETDERISKGKQDFHTKNSFKLLVWAFSWASWLLDFMGGTSRAVSRSVTSAPRQIKYAGSGVTFHDLNLGTMKGGF